MTDNLTREKHSKNQKKDMNPVGDPIAFSFIFRDSQIVYSTDQNFLIGMDLKKNHHYFLTLDKCFASCLDFCESKGVLIAGLSNNFVALINPRNHKFSILKTFMELSSHPLLTIKFVDNMQKILLTNTANEIILAERKSKKRYTKYKSRLISRIRSDSTVIHKINIIELKHNKGSIIAFISVDKVRLVWLSHLKKFKIKFIQTFEYSQIQKNLNGEVPRETNLQTKESIIDDQYFRPEVMLNLGISKEKKSKKVKSMGMHELKLILKKKNRNLLSNAGVCILGNQYKFKNINFSLQNPTEKVDESYFILTFENKCEIKLYSLADKETILIKNNWKITLKSTPIWGCFMGKNSLFFMFDNFKVSMLLLTKLDETKMLYDYGELSKVGKTSLSLIHI